MNIPVNEPAIAPHTLPYVTDCIKSGWISSRGTYLDAFESKFANYLDVPFATATTNGTTALHLAFATLSITKGDEVIIPDLTIISCALAVFYTGATPVPVDVCKKTGNIDPQSIEKAITNKTKAILVVHLYGHPADMESIMRIAQKYHLYVIEDAAQAHGATIKFQISNEKSHIKKVGSIGDIGCFSFYGNKIVTTGEGGMIVTHRKDFYEKAKRLKDLSHSPSRRFLHEEIGFNYRMTNVQAAIGLAQLEHIDTYIKKKQWMAKKYELLLHDIPELELPSQSPLVMSVWWMYAVTVSKNARYSRDQLTKKLNDAGIDTRDYFIPIHTQPAFTKQGLFQSCNAPVSLDLSNRGFYLPSGLTITQKQITYISDILHSLFK